MSVADTVRTDLFRNYPDILFVNQLFEMFNDNECKY